MGGLAGGRYIGPRGTTTGDATGGGGRSVMPNRDYLNMLAARRRRQMFRNQMRGSGGGGAPAIQGERGTLTPPGGGYSGGVIPRFQSGGAPRRTGALHGSIIGDPSSGRWVEHFPAIGQNPIYSGWGEVDTTQRGLTKRSFNNQNLPYPNIPPGGGYSGGVIPRFQSGRTMNPRAAGEEAMKRQRRMQWNARTTAGGPAGWGAYGSPFGPNARFPSPPGGWQGGGRTGTPRASLKAWGYNRPGNPNALTRSTTDEGRRRMYEAIRAGVAPGFGGRGWQAGGQFPEASFPVENQLADESPWYPDEEVGFEEAVPTQGGFDIFGRGGG